MVIHDQERYDAMIKYAKEIGDTSLQECFDRLKQWEENDAKRGVKMEIHVFNDFEPHSFEFSEHYLESGNRGICGGILFHGTPGTPDQSMAVTIDGRAYGWRIHT
jgi:hypothetical protein